jgi:hypothetical protein
MSRMPPGSRFFPHAERHAGGELELAPALVARSDPRAEGVRGRALQ